MFLLFVRRAVRATNIELPECFIAMKVGFGTAGLMDVVGDKYLGLYAVDREMGHEEFKSYLSQGAILRCVRSVGRRGNKHAQ